MEFDELVTAIVALNKGKLVGKTRLQKVAFLLEQCGMQSGLDFDYHNFGPFSADLARGAEIAVGKQLVQAIEKPGFHAVPYVEYSTSISPPRKVAKLGASRAESLLEKMEKYSAIALELAATIKFLEEEGFPRTKIDDKVRHLKPAKATDKLMRDAHELLTELDLE